MYAMFAAMLLIYGHTLYKRSVSAIRGFIEIIEII